MAAEPLKGEVHPVVPKPGALVRKITEDEIGPLVHFGQWVGDDIFCLVGSTEIQKAEEWEALTPAFMPYAYDHAVGMAGNGYKGRLCKVVGWRGINPTVRRIGSTSAQSWDSNSVAALMPMLNPATESVEGRAARLEREKAALEAGLRARMVAEGVHRSWCPEFDPILDSTGLAPRQAKGVITGTATFRVELQGYDLNDPDVVRDITRNPSSYFQMSAFTITEVTSAENVTAPLLSN